MFHKIVNQINKKKLINENEFYLNNLYIYLTKSNNVRNEIKMIKQFL